MLIGLTGGMGCGKSTAGHLFAEAGFTRIDSDEIVRDHVLTAPPVVGALRRRWGPRVVSESGAIDRPALAARIFAQDEDRLWLEALVHPRVREIWKNLVANAPTPDQEVEVPLLFEKGLEKEFDFVVCVAASSPTQFARLQERGIPRALAEQRIRKQWPLAQKTELADFVLFNDGTTGFLREQVTHLVRRLRTSG
ncbi:MAG: dephospho-CoA kinase [Opitutaceae bacterium]|jgi:dephospho-CoA kinase|nr:dephospho-CoA kinase [Opitutaceae bacterium]